MSGGNETGTYTKRLHLGSSTVMSMFSTASCEVVNLVSGLPVGPAGIGSFGCADGGRMETSP
jgi:hypothetical protein